MGKKEEKKGNPWLALTIVFIVMVLAIGASELFKKIEKSEEKFEKDSVLQSTTTALQMKMLNSKRRSL